MYVFNLKSAEKLIEDYQLRWNLKYVKARTNPTVVHYEYPGNPVLE